MLRNYLLIAIKILGRRPFFTFVSLFGITLTLVVLMLVAALLDHTFGAMPPEVHAHRMLGIFQVTLTGENEEYRGEGGYRLFDENLRDLPGAEEISLASVPRGELSFVEGQKVTLETRRVDAAYFRVLRFAFLEGAPFNDLDDSEARPVAVISRETRRRLFGGEDAVGRHFELDGQRFRVVGVVENVPIFRRVSAGDVWLPISSAKTDGYRYGLTGSFQALLLASSSASMGPLKAEAERRLNAVDPSGEGNYETLTAQANTPFEALSKRILDELGLLTESLAPATQMRLLLAFGALLFMTLPSLNLMNLNVSRILDRASEIGVRKSFGASSRTLVGQFVVENVVLTLIGGALGLLLAALLLQLVSGSVLVSYAEIGLNLRIFAWGLGLTLFFGLLSGAYPAWRMSRLHPLEALRENNP